MSKKSNVKVMVDASGHEVPAKYVSKYDKRRDALVMRIYARWERARAMLEKTLADTLKDMDTLAAAREEATGAGLADKGNFMVSSFDGNTTAEIRQTYRIFLDDRVREAQRIMVEWASGVADKIDGEPKALMLQLIDEAFAAGRTGTLPVGKILSLLRRDIKAKEWQRAKGLLEAAIEPVVSKRYVGVMRRQSREHRFERLLLNISDCWPEKSEQ